MKQKPLKKLMCLLLTTVILLTTGCTDRGTMGNSNDSDSSGSQTDTAMGRYVEEEIDLSESLWVISGMKQLVDGRLVITDRQSGLLASEDNGATWTSESHVWLEEKLRTAYVMDIQMTNDGTLGIIYDDYEERESESAFELSPECALVRKDGTVVPIVLSLTEEEMYANRIWMSDTGRVFVTTLGDTIYEIKEDGSSKSYLTAEGRPMLLRFWKDLMVIDGYDFKTPLLYDMEKEEYVEDTALEEFVENQYGERGFNGGSWYDLNYFFGKDGTLYLVGKKGLHSHVIGESKIEQLIDGSLSRLGSPQYGMIDMLPLGNDEFLAVFNSGKLVRFSFDPNVPSVPNERLKLYSLEESYDLLTAISLYQISHPEVFVEYEIGMEEGSGVTREDALKKLNTEIMAGEGPDLLMLDGLPMDSYIEKGLLLDLSSTIDELTEEEELFTNLFQAFKREGGTSSGIYVVPGQAEFPVMLGRQQYVSGMKDLASVADEMELIRRDHPGKDILGICSEKGIMKIFGVASAPAWKTENGEIDEEAVAEFLMQMKRIYESQMDGIAQKSIDKYDSSASWYSEEIGENWMYDLSIYGVNTLDYVGDYTQFMAGLTTYPYGYFDITSAAKAKGYEDTILVPMAGQSSRVFVPQAMLGISASASEKELAEDFLKEFLGKDVQCALGGFAVNRAALDELFTPKEEYLGENNQYGSMVMIDEDGVEVELDVYFPDEDEINVLRGWMEEADTPYIEDTVFEETVFEEGAKFIQGNQSLEEALDAIWQQLAIYMSE